MLDYEHLFPSVSGRPYSATAGLGGPEMPQCLQPNGGLQASWNGELQKGRRLLQGQLVCLLPLGAERHNTNQRINVILPVCPEKSTVIAALSHLSQFL